MPRVELTQPRHFRGVNQPVTVAGWTIRDPITYVSGTAAAADASTIITSYSVGSNPHRAAQLPYWPSYAQADADQRARYLEWMAGGRQGIDIEIGYVFIFFYGLEWRALRDRADADLILHELRRLYDIHAARSGSFGRYAADFVAFVIADRLENLNEHEIEGALGWLVEESSTALSVILAWYCLKQRPLPVSYAMAVAATMEDAARSVVTKRSPKELADLFRARYQERFGHGLVLVGAKRSLALEYSPASPTLLRSGGHPMVRVPNVLGRKSQIGPLVNIWNQCVEDLRKLSTLKQKHGGELTPASWAALPPELRAQYDHPAQEQWDAAVRAAPRLGPFHLLTFGSLASILGIQGAAKLSAAQVRNVAETAAELDYAMEPDGRVGRSGARLGDDVLVWRATDVSCPNPELYRPVRALLALTTSVALADGALADEELHVVITMLTNLFALDEGFRARVVALQHLLARKPASATAVAKKLQAKRTREEMVKVGRVLVAVAGADGEISEREEHVLGSLYKALGLSKADLAGAIASSGARLASDAVAEVQKGSRRGKGEAIPPPPSQTSAVELDQAAIASILADTREVAAMLAEVLDQDEEEPASKELRTPPPAPVAAHPGVILPIAKGLDIRYHGILGELLTRSQWSKEDARALSARCQLMPGAVVETINAWSDEVHGDFLIDDSDGWLVRADLLKEQSA